MAMEHLKGIAIPSDKRLVYNPLNGSYHWRDATEAEKRQEIAAAGKVASNPKRDYATLADFRAEHPHEQTPATFAAWLTWHQCTPRHAIQLELQAKQEGLNLSADMQAETEEEVLDPRLRRATPMADIDAPLEEEPPPPALSDEDLEAMALTDHMSLAALRQEGIVRPGMSRALFDARLKRAKQSLDARWRRAVEAELGGWFQGQGRQPVRVPTVPSPNGDTLTEHRSAAPATRHLDPHARRSVINAVNANLRQLDQRLRRGTSQGTIIRARAEER